VAVGRIRLATIRIDLHLHSNVSDGRCPPRYIVERAVESDIGIISVTDHDTIVGSLEAAEVAAGRIKVIPGAEFSTCFRGEEIHILGYFPRGVGAAVRRLLENLQEERVSRMKLCLLNLRRRGCRVGYEQVIKFVEGRSVSRSHIARALVEQGYASSVYEAFSRFLASGSGVIPPPSLTPQRLFKMLAADGAVSVWAHPESSQFDRYIETFAEQGLSGVEVCVKRRGQYSLYFKKTARDKGLLLTYGSDWHGFAEDETFGVTVERADVEPFLRLF